MRTGGWIVDLTYEYASVPEPGLLGLLCLALTGLFARKSLRRERY
jgi:hypothetical protein